MTDRVRRKRMLLRALFTELLPWIPRHRAIATKTPLSPNSASAVLSTTWLGKPLSIHWQHHPGQDAYDGNLSISVTTPRAAIENFAKRQATAGVVLLGRPRACPVDIVSPIITGTSGQREPVPDNPISAAAVASQPEFSGQVKCAPPGTL